MMRDRMSVKYDVEHRERSGRRRDSNPWCSNVVEYALRLGRGGKQTPGKCRGLEKNKKEAALRAAYLTNLKVSLHVHQHAVMIGADGANAGNMHASHQALW